MDLQHLSSRCHGWHLAPFAQADPGRGALGTAALMTSVSDLCAWPEAPRGLFLRGILPWEVLPRVLLPPAFVENVGALYSSCLTRRDAAGVGIEEIVAGQSFRERTRRFELLLLVFVSSLLLVLVPVVMVSLLFGGST